MRIKLIIPVLSGAFLLLAAGCGRAPVPELEVVPGTSLIHIHIESGFNSRAMELAGEGFRGFLLADSLLKSGPVGVSLVGIDITSLEPQLLILSRDVSVEYTTALAARQLDLDPRQEDSRVDLVSEQGYARASVSERNGWTALYIGPAPHVTMESWLDLERENSLVADEALVGIIPEEAHITVLFPGNLFGFLSMLPLERQISWWQSYKDATAVIRPAALVMGLSWPDPPEDSIHAVLNIARRQGGTVSLSMEMQDSGIDADSAFALLLNMLEGMY